MSVAVRTDMAVELKEDVGENSGIVWQSEKKENLTVTRISVVTDDGCRAIGKPKGNYLNIDVPDMTLHGDDYRVLEDVLVGELNSFSFPSNNILVAGLGNRNITPDTLGPVTADGILATRHLSNTLKEQTGLQKLHSVSVVLPGVLGQTGIETAEILKGIIRSANIEGLIVIDAFAAKEPARLGKAVQISDAGISPGSGVGNNRREISQNTLGIPVLALGVPTCVDAVTLAQSFTDAPLKNGTEQMIVTPREIDMLIDRAAAVLARAVNRFLQPETDRELLLSIV